LLLIFQHYYYYYIKNKGLNAVNFECDSQLLLLFTVRMAVQCISDTVFIFVREQRTQIGLKIGSQQFTSAAVNGHIYCVYC